MMDALMERDTRSDLDLSRATLDRYLAMYANADTLEAGPDVCTAIDELYSRAHAAGLMAAPIRAQFAP
jgi:predicted solute-binding protein